MKRHLKSAMVFAFWGLVWLKSAGASPFASDRHKLLSAIMANDVFKVRMILTDPYKTDNIDFKKLSNSAPVGETVLTAAVKWGNPEMVEDILNFAPEARSIKNQEGFQPLELAVRENKVGAAREIFKGMIKHGLPKGQKSPLDLALELENGPMIREIGEWMKNSNQSNALTKTDANGETYLTKAMKAKNDKIMDVLLRTMPQLAVTPNKRGQYPLTLAMNLARRDYVFQVMNVISELGHADGLGMTSEEGETILTFAVKNGDDQLVNEILKMVPFLVEIPNEKGELPIVLSVNHADLIIFPNLLYGNADLTSLPKSKILQPSGETLATLAVKTMRPSVLKKVLELKPTLDLANQKGDSPLALAIQLGDMEMVEDLIKAGAGSEGAFEVAVQMGNPEMMARFSSGKDFDGRKMILSLLKQKKTGVARTILSGSSDSHGECEGEALPVTHAHDPMVKNLKKFKFDLECSMCLEMVGSNGASENHRSKIQMPGCGHCFCKFCLESWEKGKNQKTCPNCRETFSPLNIFEF